VESDEMIADPVEEQEGEKAYTDVEEI